MSILNEGEREKKTRGKALERELEIEEKEVELTNK